MLKGTGNILIRGPFSVYDYACSKLSQNSLANNICKLHKDRKHIRAFQQEVLHTQVSMIKP